jgi:hypothetical protein
MDLPIVHNTLAESVVLGRPGLPEGGHAQPACPISLSF